MQSNEYLNEFLAQSAEYLLANPGIFFQKLKEGDISAIKTVLDFLYKTAPKNADKPKAKTNTNKHEDMTYEEAFEYIKESISEHIPEDE